MKLRFKKFGIVVLVCLALVECFSYFLWSKYKGTYREPMQIVFATNDAYIPHVATAITSIVDNADKRDIFEFYILESFVSDKNKRMLQSYVNALGTKLTFIHVDSAHFEEMKVRRQHLSKEAYYRFIIPKILKGPKALYLDGDIVVLKSLRSLYETDITGVYAAVVRDENWKTILGEGCDIKNRTRFPTLRGYFNDGVMLLNLDKMRSEEMVEKLFRNERKMAKSRKLKLEDQDVLNYTFNNNVIFLPTKYNAMIDPHLLIPAPEESEIVIMHLTRKPWKIPQMVNNIYWTYRSKTPWKMDQKAFWRKKTSNRWMLKFKKN